MNGIHDMGGMHGFGSVEVERDEPVFHSRWEARVLGMTQSLDSSGIYNLDEFRHEIELMGAPAYITATYYGRWLFALESLLARKGILRRAEVEARIAERHRDAAHYTSPRFAARNWPLPASAQDDCGPSRREVAVVPRFAVGDPVRALNLHPAGHTRLTAYARGKQGVIRLVNPHAWVLPDTRAHHAGDNPQPVYAVAFSAAELWGPQAEANVWVNIDMCEDYLEAVEQPDGE